MPTRRNKLTGEVAEFNDDGEKIRVISPGFTNRPKATSNLGAKLGSSSEEAYKDVVDFPKKVTRFLGEAAPVIGNILGDIVGGPAAGIVGSLVGSQLQTGLQRKDPDYFGQASDDEVQ